MNIADILSRHATSFGDRIAIVERRRRITFAELNQTAMSAAGQLSDAGLSAGMRALVVCPMSIDLYVALIGLFRLGAVAVFVDPAAGGANLAKGIARVRPDAFIGTPRAHLLRLTSPAVRAIPIRIAMGGWVPGARTLAGRATSIAQPVASCCNGAPAIITFTSGTTGAAKAVARSHGFLRAQHGAIADSLRLTPGDVDLTTLPIFLLANLASGVTSIIPDADLRAPGGIDPLPVLDQIRSEQPTRTVASPALLEQLASGAVRTGLPLGTLRKVFTGGAPVFPRTLDALAAIAPNDHCGLRIDGGGTDRLYRAAGDLFLRSGRDAARRWGAGWKTGTIHSRSHPAGSMGNTDPVTGSFGVRARHPSSASRG